MSLSRDELIKLAIDDYFIACNDKDLERVMRTFSRDCLMWFPASPFRYQGHDALRVHFEDFFANFPTVNFHDFINTVDPESQSLTSRFTVQLIDPDGVEAVMRNCNFFYVDDSGRFSEIVIYNSKPLDKGFNAGNQA